MTSEVIVRQGLVQDTVAEMNTQLPPLPNQLPQWSRVGTLDKSRYPKPFLKDRLNPLPSTKDGVKFSDDLDEDSLDNNCDMDPSQRIQHLERSIHFLRQQHLEILSSLHEEIEALRKENKELQFKIIMKTNMVPTPPQSASSVAKRQINKTKEKPREKSASSASSVSSSSRPVDSGKGKKTNSSAYDHPKLVVLQDKIKELKLQLQEARNQNVYLTKLLEEGEKKVARQQKDSSSVHSETVEDVDLTTNPITVTNQMTGKRNPTAEDYEAIIRQLQGLNEKQSNELKSLKSDLREVLYSHKWTPDAYLLAKAYVADEEKVEEKSGKLPKIQLRQPTRKLPNPSYLPKAQSTISLPAMKQTLGTRAAERKKRTQILQKARLRKEVIP